MLFDPNKTYPQDDVGCYRELVGRVVGHRAPDRVAVETPEGTFTGIWHRDPPPVGSTATIRIYDSGGGFYPDNQIVGYRTNNQRGKAVGDELRYYGDGGCVSEAAEAFCTSAEPSRFEVLSELARCKRERDEARAERDVWHTRAVAHRQARENSERALDRIQAVMKEIGP